MKRYLRIAVPFLLVLLSAGATLSLMPPVARAADATANVVDRNGRSFNATTGALTTDGGEALVTEAYPLTSKLRTWLVLDGVTLASAAADSCYPIQTQGIRIVSVTVKCVPAGGAGSKVRLALSLRNNIDGSNDSLRISNFYGFPQFDNAALAQIDTTNAGHIFTGSTSAPWSGEFTLTFDRARVGPDGTSALFFYPNAQTHMLSKIYGAEPIAEWFSLRARNLAISGALSAKVWVWVTGAAL